LALLRGVRLRIIIKACTITPCSRLYSATQPGITVNSAV
jgi:hypothetical protein